MFSAQLKLFMPQVSVSAMDGKWFEWFPSFGKLVVSQLNMSEK